MSEQERKDSIKTILKIIFNRCLEEYKHCSKTSESIKSLEVILYDLLDEGVDKETIHEYSKEFIRRQHMVEYETLLVLLTTIFEIDKDTIFPELKQFLEFIFTSPVFMLSCFRLSKHLEEKSEILTEELSTVNKMSNKIMHKLFLYAKYNQQEQTNGTSTNNR